LSGWAATCHNPDNTGEANTKGKLYKTIGLSRHKKKTGILKSRHLLVVKSVGPKEKRVLGKTVGKKKGLVKAQNSLAEQRGGALPRE